MAAPDRTAPLSGAFAETGGRDDADFLDLRSVFTSSPVKPGRAIFHELCEEEIEPIHAPTHDERTIFSPLRAAYSPSKFFRSPVSKGSKAEGYVLTTPVMLKKPRKHKGKTPTGDRTQAASPFSGWKVEQTDKQQYRFVMSPLPLVVTPNAVNEEDNHSFLTFAQSLPAITDLNNLDSSPSVTVSPLTPEPPVTKL